MFQPMDYFWPFWWPQGINVKIKKENSYRKVCTQYEVESACAAQRYDREHTTAAASCCEVESRL